MVLFEVAANAHNDALMVTFTLLALMAALGSSNGFLSSASFTVGALVKYLSGLGLVWATIASVARGTSWRNRGLRLAGIIAISLTLVVAISARWLELPDVRLVEIEGSWACPAYGAGSQRTLLDLAIALAVDSDPFADRRALRPVHRPARAG